MPKGRLSNQKYHSGAVAKAIALQACCVVVVLNRHQSTPYDVGVRVCSLNANRRSKAAKLGGDSDRVMARFEILKGTAQSLSERALISSTYLLH